MYLILIILIGLIINKASFGAEAHLFLIDDNHQKLKKSAINVKKTPFGYSLESSFEDGFQCSDVLTQEIRYLYFFTKSLKKRAELRKKCSGKMLGESYYLDQFQDKEESEFEKLLKFYYSIRDREKNTIEDYSKVLKKIKEYKGSLLKELLVLHWHFYFEKIPNARSRIEKIAQVLQYKRISSLNYKDESFFIQNKSNIVRMKQIIFEILRLTKARLGGTEYQVLVGYLAYYDWEDFSIELNDFIKSESKFSEGDLSSILSDYRWGVRLPHIWLRELKSFSNEGLKEAYLEKALSLPQSIVSNKLFDENINYIYKSIDNLKIQKSLKKRKLNLNHKNSTRRMRAYFLENLKSKQYQIYSIFELIKLGDLNLDYLNYLKD